MSALRPPYRSRMSIEPPPPPNEQELPCRRTQNKRPKAPPPRRPPRPVAKQKMHDNMQNTSTSETVAMGTMSPESCDTGKVDTIFTGNGTKVQNYHGHPHDNDKVMAKPPAGKREKRDKPAKKLETSSKKDSHLLTNDVSKESRRNGRSSRPVARVTELPNPRVYGDLPSLTGYGDVGVRLTNHVNQRPICTCPQRSISPADLALYDSNSHLNTLRLRKGSLDDDVLSRGKPIIQYVQVAKKEGDGQHLANGQLTERDKSQSRSVDELDRYNIFMDLSHINCDYFYNRAFRSSFLEEVTLKRQTIGFHSDVQTLLKHSQKEEEHIYSLPQPQSYSDNTLKAVKLITEKYDTLQRRRLHAASFREGDLAKLRGTLTLHREMSADKKRQSGFVGNHDCTAHTSPSKSLPSSPLLPRQVSIATEELNVADVVCLVTGLSKKDVSRLEMFYKGCDTQVVVCECLADIYLGNTSGCGTVADWSLYHTGVPILVLNTGQGHRQRELHIYLAERETGFPLWKDKVNYLTNLEVSSDQLKVLTMRLSGSLSKMARFGIKCEDAAQAFLDTYTEMTRDPNDELWRVSTEKCTDAKKSKRKKNKKRRKPITTQDISQPCNFQLINKLEPCRVLAVETVSMMLQNKADVKVRQSVIDAQQQVVHVDRDGYAVVDDVATS